MPTADILTFPLSGTGTSPAPRLPAFPRRIASPLARAVAGHTFIALHEVAQLFGIANRPVRGQLDYVRAQIAQRSFPVPALDRLWRGHLVSGIDAVCKRARWRRVAVEAWFDNAIPPPQRAAAEDVARELTRAALAQSAVRLAGKGATGTAVRLAGKGAQR